MPDIMSNELFNLDFPTRPQLRVTNVLDLPHESVDVLNQDVVSGNQDTLLVFNTGYCLRSRIFRVECRFTVYEVIGLSLRSLTLQFTLLLRIELRLFFPLNLHDLKLLLEI